MTVHGVKVEQARLRAFPPQAVLGPALTPGWRGTTRRVLCVFSVPGGPFMGLLAVMGLSP